MSAARPAVYARAKLGEHGLIYTVHAVELDYDPEREVFRVKGTNATYKRAFSKSFAPDTWLLCTLKCRDIMQQVLVPGRLSRKATGSYAGQNAYGARVTVETSSASGYGLAPQREGSGSGMYGLNSYDTYSEMPVPRDRARQIGPRITMVLCSRAVPPYVERAFVRIPPSLINPAQEDRNIRTIATQSLAYAFVVADTREVLLARPFKLYPGDY